MVWWDGEVVGPALASGRALPGDFVRVVEEAPVALRCLGPDDVVAAATPGERLLPRLPVRGAVQSIVAHLCETARGVARR